MKLAKIAFLVCLIFFLIQCRKELTPEEVKQEISKSERLMRIDQLCNGLPKPEGFQFINKKISGNSFTLSISYHYYSKKSLREVEAFYSDFLSANGWIVGKSRSYEKGNQQVDLELVNFPKANYSIYCAEVYPDN
jgi:hypothetical protein